MDENEKLRHKFARAMKGLDSIALYKRAGSNHPTPEAIVAIATKNDIAAMDNEKSPGPEPGPKPCSHQWTRIDYIEQCVLCGIPYGLFLEREKQTKPKGGAAA